MEQHREEVLAVTQSTPHPEDILAGVPAAIPQIKTVEGLILLMEEAEKGSVTLHRRSCSSRRPSRVTLEVFRPTRSKCSSVDYKIMYLLKMPSIVSPAANGVVYMLHPMKDQLKVLSKVTDLLHYTRGSFLLPLDHPLESIFVISQSVSCCNPEESHCYLCHIFEEICCWCGSLEPEADINSDMKRTLAERL